MRFFSTILKRVPAPREREEPTGNPPVELSAPEDVVLEDAFDLATTHPCASENVFSLLGGDVCLKGRSTVESMSEPALLQAVVRIDADELIDALHAHYCEALVSSDGLSIGAWTTSASAPVITKADQRASPLAAESRVGRSADRAIIGMFSEPRRLEEAIGPLTAESGGASPFDAVDMSPESAPEILRLFAPPEYRGSASSLGNALPSALARREHHALAIDSPLPELHAAAASKRVHSHEAANTDVKRNTSPEMNGGTR